LLIAISVAAVGRFGRAVIAVLCWQARAILLGNGKAIDLPRRIVYTCLQTPASSNCRASDYRSLTIPLLAIPIRLASKHGVALLRPRAPAPTDRSTAMRTTSCRKLVANSAPGAAICARLRRRAPAQLQTCQPVPVMPRSEEELCRQKCDFTTKLPPPPNTHATPEAVPPRGAADCDRERPPAAPANPRSRRDDGATGDRSARAPARRARR
jgi:hypothetical protein